MTIEKFSSAKTLVCIALALCSGAALAAGGVSGESVQTLFETVLDALQMAAVPVVTIAAGMTLLGETMSFVGLMGAAMILCGVWSSETGMKRVSAVLSGADPEKLSARISF